MKFSLITIFPQMLAALTDHGVTGRANRNGLVEIESVDLRAYGIGTHRVLDDRPFGGGPGMVMMAEPIIQCVSDLRRQSEHAVPLIYLSPQGQRLEHKHVCELAQLPAVILLCGRYAGVDQRALDLTDAEEWSIGDYVLSGGELAAMVLVDAVVRQLPGVLGNEESSAQDSFTDGMLDCIHYTRPKTVDEVSVPEVLVSGDHAAVRRWRARESIGRTWLRRPDLLEQLDLDPHSKQLLDEYQHEYKHSEKLK